MFGIHLAKVNRCWVVVFCARSSEAFEFGLGAAVLFHQVC